MGSKTQIQKAQTQKKPSQSVRISLQGSEQLAQIVSLTGKKQIDILDEALGQYAAQLFWNQVDAGYLKHSQHLQTEYGVLDAALDDGLEGLP